MAEISGIRRSVASMLSEKIQFDIQDPELDIIEAGLLDSLMFVEFLADLEQAFHLVFTLETLDLDHFRSVGQITELVMMMTARRDVTAWAASAGPPRPELGGLGLRKSAV